MVLPKPLLANKKTVDIVDLSSKALFMNFTEEEISVLKILEENRPIAYRHFDQIPMVGLDMLRQIKLIGSYLNDTKVVFIGDYDGAAILLGLLAVKLGYGCPKEMLIVDFDQRVLRAAIKIAIRFGFSEKLKILSYNVFDKVSVEHIGKYDWFYTNPPFGSNNQGESARLFISRGFEFVKPNGKGCIILPDDAERPWTRTSMDKTKLFLKNHGWRITEQKDKMHYYHLDDDDELNSNLILAAKINTNTLPSTTYIGRKVGFSDIPFFMGKMFVHHTLAIFLLMVSQFLSGIIRFIHKRGENAGK